MKKVLMISTDRQIFVPGSEVRRRMLDYGGLFIELHIIVLAKKKLGLREEKLATNTFVYPTNAFGPLSQILFAYQIGRRVLRAGNQDWIISSQDPFETGLIAWLLKWMFKISWQAQVHTDFLSSYFWQESLVNKIRVLLGKFLLPRADKIRVVSERIKKSLDNLKLKSEPIVLPIFVPKPSADLICQPDQDLSRKYPQFSFIILMASRLTREKNFMVALSAFAEVIRHRPTLGLVIVGRGPEKLKLQRLAKALETDHQIIFEDWNNHLECYYRSADLFMLSSNYEGYGRTLVEAGFGACPVLTTNIGLVGEIINRQNALICPVGDEDCLAEKIAWAVADKSDLKKLGQRLRADLEERYQDKKEYLNKYQEAL